MTGQQQGPKIRSDLTGPLTYSAMAAIMQVSNEIIARCCAVIKLNDVFSPNVDAVTVTLQQSIAAGGEWKSMYLRTAQAVTLRSSRPWDHDLSPIFAHVDAFVQRCADLLEVCKAQLQFAGQRPLPVFGGTRGDEIKHSIQDIQVCPAFHVLL